MSGRNARGSRGQNLPYKLKGRSEKIRARSSRGGQHIGIVCPRVDILQGVVRARFSKKASAGSDQGIL